MAKSKVRKRKVFVGSGRSLIDYVKEGVAFVPASDRKKFLDHFNQEIDKFFITWDYQEWRMIKTILRLIHGIEKGGVVKGFLPAVVECNEMMNRFFFAATGLTDLHSSTDQWSPTPLGVEERQQLELMVSTYELQLENLSVKEYTDVYEKIARSSKNLVDEEKL